MIEFLEVILNKIMVKNYKIVLITISLSLTSCLNIEKDPEIEEEIEADFLPYIIEIVGENEIIENIAMVKAFNFDDPILNENEDDLIAFGPSKNYRPENGKFKLYLPDIVSNEKFRKLSDVCDDGKLSNPDAQVLCLQYFRAYNTEGIYIGYFEYGYINLNEDSWFDIQYWYSV